MTTRKRIGRSAALAALAIVVAATGCKRTSTERAGGGSKGGGTITIAGSNSIQPFADHWSEEFTGGTVNVQAGGSTAGIKAVQDGTANIGMSSRELKDSEKKGLVETVVAYDGISVIVHRTNPVSDLTTQQVRDIYTHKLRNWREVGGEDRRITVITREDGSGTRGTFEELVMGKGGEIAPASIVQAYTGGLRKMVATDKNAIGYMTMGQVTDEVKALRLNGVAATEPNVANGSYALKRPFLFLTKGEPDGTAKAFIEFVLSPAGQKLVKEEGLVPVGKAGAEP